MTGMDPSALPLNKLLSATHIIRLSGEIVRLWRREKEKKACSGL